MSVAPLSGAKRLRELLKDPKKIVVCPGVFDGLTARIALSKGFDALYMVPLTPPAFNTKLRVGEAHADCPNPPLDRCGNFNVEAGLG